MVDILRLLIIAIVIYFLLKKIKNNTSNKKKNKSKNAQGLKDNCRKELKHEKNEVNSAMEDKKQNNYENTQRLKRHYSKKFTHVKKVFERTNEDEQQEQLISYLIANDTLDRKVSVLYPDKYSESFITFYSSDKYRDLIIKELKHVSDSTIMETFSKYYDIFEEMKNEFYSVVLAAFLTRVLSLEELEYALVEIKQFEEENKNIKFKKNTIEPDMPFFIELASMYLNKDINKQKLRIGWRFREILQSTIRFLNYNDGKLLLSKFDNYIELPDLQMSLIEGRLIEDDIDGAIYALDQIDDNYDYKFRGFRLITIWMAEHNDLQGLKKYIKKVDRRKEKNTLFAMDRAIAYNHTKFNGIDDAVKLYPKMVGSALGTLIVNHDIPDFLTCVDKYLPTSDNLFESTMNDLFEYNLIKMTDCNRHSLSLNTFNGSQSVKELLVLILDAMLDKFEETNLIELGVNKKYVYDCYWRLGMKYLFLKETGNLGRIYKLLKNSKNKQSLKEYEAKIESV